MTQHRVSRWLRGFDAHGDDLVVEVELPEALSVELLRRIFSISAANPMYDSYPVASHEAEALRPYVGSVVDREDLAFFIEADREP